MTTFTAETIAAFTRSVAGERVPPFQVVRMEAGDMLDSSAIDALGEEGMDQVKRRIGIDGLRLEILDLGMVAVSDAPADTHPATGEEHA